MGQSTPNTSKDPSEAVGQQSRGGAGGQEVGGMQKL